jgi:hypothetical protein
VDRIPPDAAGDRSRQGQPIALGKIGPLAIVATTGKSHEQARMFAALAEADRPIKIFRELHLARQWLESQPNVPD